MRHGTSSTESRTRDEGQKAQAAGERHGFRAVLHDLLHLPVHHPHGRGPAAVGGSSAPVETAAVKSDTGEVVEDLAEQRVRRHPTVRIIDSYVVPADRRSPVGHVRAGPLRKTGD